MKKRRVVVTGIGVISSVGIGKEQFWEGIKKGKSGITKISSIDTSNFKCQYGGEVKNFSPEDFIPSRKIKFLGRTSQLAIAAAELSLEDAKFPYQEIFRRKIGVIIGTTEGEHPLEELILAWAKGGLKEIDRRKVIQSAVSNISANVGIYFKTLGPNFLIPTACAAGNYAIGYGYDLIRWGEADFILAGGAEAFSRLAYVGFQRLYSMSPDVCQPFDKNRKGMLLGEGAGILFLESLNSAYKRSASIYAEILGYGLTCDAYHPTALEPKSVAKCMERALESAEVTYKDVDYICAHGTGTPINDKIECKVIKEVFKERAKEVPVSSIKSMLGHCMGAASSIEAAACCLAIKEGIIPPTINFQTPDPECDIDCVPNKARKMEVNIVVNNGFAFGGNNCCLVLGKVNN
ncbi:MAG: hypothetical protein B6D55_05100 [Candidatus Omnitrophica bacterium 4484_70.2]|nr:MAG: hypothetical protein B6D55_05100 [Candidatus Omnitrophica bacterium 4484_70.2]